MVLPSRGKADIARLHARVAANFEQGMTEADLMGPCAPCKLFVEAGENTRGQIAKLEAALNKGLGRMSRVPTVREQLLSRISLAPAIRAALGEMGSAQWLYAVGMRRRLTPVTSLLLTLSLENCATPPPNLEKIVPEARGEEPIQGLFMTCTSAYALTQDCKTLSDPPTQRMIVIGALPISIAGSADGKVVLVTSGFTRRELKARSLTYSPASAQVFEAVKAQLARVRVQIVRARAIILGSLGDTYAVRAYVLELDGDGYAPLKALSTAP